MRGRERAANRYGAFILRSSSQPGRGLAALSSLTDGSNHGATRSCQRDGFGMALVEDFEDGQYHEGIGIGTPINIV